MRKAILILAIVTAASLAGSQTAVTPFRTPRVTFLDQNGLPLVGGCVFTYQGGTSTPQATYTDHTGGTQNANPVILDSTGSAEMWLAAPSYKFVVYSSGGTNCATGTLEWTVDQVPGDSFMNGAISGATITGGTISGAAITGGSINNAPIGATSPSTALFTVMNAGITNGVVNPALCASTPTPAWCAGSDMGGWINAAFAACSNNCTVSVPAGSYNYATTIVVPTGVGASLACQGATLFYTGSSDAVEIYGANEMLPILTGCFFDGTSSGSVGIHTRGGTVLITGVFVTGFTNGDCIENEGSSSITYLNAGLTGCKNGVHNIGLASTAPASNIHFIGGFIENNSQYGVYEDATQSGTAGLNAKNSYEGVEFLGNGTQAFLQGCNSCELRNNAFTLYTSKTNQVLAGDGTYPANAPVIAENLFFGSYGYPVTNDIDLVNARGAIISDNLDESNPTVVTNFVNNGSASTATFVEPNSLVSTSTAYTAGSGTFAEICQNAVLSGTNSCQFSTLLAGTLQPTNKYVARGNTSAIAAQTLVTAPATALYNVNAAVSCDTSVASATVTVTVAWTDPSSTAQTAAATATCTTLGSSSYAAVSPLVNAKTNTAITVATSVSGSPNYDLAATLNQATAN